MLCAKVLKNVGLDYAAKPGGAPFICKDQSICNQTTAMKQVLVKLTIGEKLKDGNVKTSLWEKNVSKICSSICGVLFIIVFL